MSEADRPGRPPSASGEPEAAEGETYTRVEGPGITAEPPPRYRHPFGELIGLEFFRYETGRSGCRLEVQPSLMNPEGALHGAVLFAMADTGMGGAAYTVLDLAGGERCAATQLSIAFHAPVRSGQISCESHVIRRGKRVVALESEIRSGDQLVASAMGTFSIFVTRRA